MMLREALDEQGDTLYFAMDSLGDECDATLMRIARDETSTVSAIPPGWNVYPDIAISGKWKRPSAQLSLMPQTSGHTQPRCKISNVYLRGSRSAGKHCFPPCHSDTFSK